MKYLLTMQFLAILILVSGCKAQNVDNRSEESPNYPEVIYPKIRIWTTPSSGEEAKFNSPSFEWPSVRNMKYSVRLSTTKDFEEDLIEKDDIPFAIYNPHTELGEGLWYWQYKTTNGDWNEVDSFRITSGTKKFVSPDVKELIANIPSEHPRVLVDKNEWDEFRERAKSYQESEDIIREADQCLNLLPPKESDGQSTNTGNTLKQKQKLALNASRDLGNRVGGVLEKLPQAYVLTGDEKYFHVAKKWMLEISEWDPAGVTRLNNFGDSYIMLTMALGVDVFWDLLSPAEREKIIIHAEARASQFYRKWINGTESRSSSMHVWQHIIHRMVQTSVALMNEAPQAAVWMQYLYEIWIAQNPKMGETDGAWFNGCGYYTMNTITQFDVSMIFKTYTGVDFLHSDWYRNSPDWLLYAFPPNSVADGFCNDGGKYIRPNLTYVSLADLFFRFTGNQNAAWYATQVMKTLKSELSEDHHSRWFRIQHSYLLEPPDANTEFDMPQAAVFPDVGVAYMNTSLENAETNLMLSIRSSPFGSLGHTHADQNTFNLAFGGERLFYNTGYRPAMGDPHFLADYKHTRGHNGIMIDGMGQPFNAGAYGFIPRFLHGEQISYAVGDASNAYSGSDLGENTDHGVTKFRRHYIILRPSIIVVYDELEADHEAEWSWLLHNDKGFRLDSARQTISAGNELADARVSLMASTDIRFQVSDQFEVTPENFTGKIDPYGNLDKFENQWHFKGVSNEKVASMRYLAIIQVKTKSGNPVMDQVIYDEETGSYTVGEWEIIAEMNEDNPGRIEVRNLDGKAALVSSGELNFNGKKHRGTSDLSSKLLEEIDGKKVFIETLDEIPASIQRVMMK